MQCLGFRIAIGVRVFPMEARVAKRGRLRGEAVRRILHVGGSSMAGLLELLAKLREQGPEIIGTTRWHLLQAREAIFGELSMTIQVPLAEGGGSFAWELLDPLKLLPRLIRERSDLRALFTAAIRRSPPSIARPWHLIVGFDAFTPGSLTMIISRLPHASGELRSGCGEGGGAELVVDAGNKLQLDKSRSSMILSITFRELGQAAVSNGYGWAIPVCVRTVMIDKAAVWCEGCECLSRQCAVQAAQPQISHTIARWNLLFARQPCRSQAVGPTCSDGSWSTSWCILAAWPPVGWRLPQTMARACCLLACRTSCRTARGTCTPSIGKGLRPSRFASSTTMS